MYLRRPLAVVAFIRGCLQTICGRPDGRARTVPCPYAERRTSPRVPPTARKPRPRPMAPARAREDAEAGPGHTVPAPAMTVRRVMPSTSSMPSILDPAPVQTETPSPRSVARVSGLISSSLGFLNPAECVAATTFRFRPARRFASARRCRRWLLPPLYPYSLQEARPP